MQRTRKAIGEIMAAMILLLIASLAGALLFTTSLSATSEKGFELTSQFNAEGTKFQERYEILYSDKTSTEIYLFLYNYGKQDLNIVEIYLDGNKVDKSDVYIYYNSQKINLYDFNNNYEILTGKIYKMEITNQNNIISDKYTVTCISERGNKNESVWID